MARTHKFIDEMSDLAKLSGFRSAGGFKNPLSEKSGIRTTDIRQISEENLDFQWITAIQMKVFFAPFSGFSAQQTSIKPDIRMAYFQRKSAGRILETYPGPKLNKFLPTFLA